MTELLFVNLLEANAWNPNVMGEEEYAALKQDMHVHGLNGVDPVLVSPKPSFLGVGATTFEGFYVIVDGEHRWRAAKELGWKEILCEIREISEDEAKALCYRRNRERGTIDPFKEALLFKSELPKLTQAKIAGKYGVDQSTVSHRLSLLKLDEKVLETAKQLPRGIITPSHLEPIVSLDPKDQRQIVDDLRSRANSGDPVSVKDIENHAQRMKKQRAEEEALEKALVTAKFLKCPTCREKPERAGHQGLPWVRCRNWHTAWNLETGKREYEPEVYGQKDLTGRSEPVKSSVLRSTHTLKELHDIFVERIKEVVPKLELNTIKLSGKFEGSAFRVEIEAYSSSLHFSLQHGLSQEWFNAEKHDYRSGEKTAVHAASPERVDKVKELIENAFDGKLGIESKRLKKSKNAAEKIHALHSESLEANKIETTEDPEEALGAEDETEASA